jgi:hypothetical protein
MTMHHSLIAVAAAITLHAAPAAAADTTLDYGFFKTSVEPIFLKKRPEHVRCYVCHSESTNAFKLQHLEHGAKAYTDEQSRKNFESAASLVVPGDISKSRLLLQPLAPQEGGNPYHSGGRQFESKNDPDWKILAEWVNGKKAPVK